MTVPLNKCQMIPVHLHLQVPAHLNTGRQRKNLSQTRKRKKRARRVDDHSSAVGVRLVDLIWIDITFS